MAAVIPTSKIMVIRHAEKPNGEPGVMPDGTQNSEALTATGWRRAELLVKLFTPRAAPGPTTDLATPQTIFASGIAHHSESLRPQQTVTPLATTLKLSIKTKYAKGNETGLVQAAMAVGQNVLIAWEHEAIPDIAALIRGNRDDLPAHWPADRFDLVWVFDRQDGSENWSFNQLPQLLLPGDFSDPILLKSS